MNTLELLTARVGHARLSPTTNEFTYKVFYVLCPVSETPTVTPSFFSFNASNIFSIYTKDHGARDSTSWRTWIKKECASRGMQLQSDDTVLLIAHPRLFGYAFNPISYWLIYEKNSYLKGVLCEVNNTFGDNHNYLLMHQNFKKIEPADEFSAKKNLYVSPFNQVPPGSYTFTFEVTPEKFKSVINYFENGTHILNTFMGGKRSPLTNRSIAASILTHPLMTFLVVGRIHFQAMRLWWKGVAPTISSRPPSTRGKTTQGTITPR